MGENIDDFQQFVNTKFSKFTADEVVVIRLRTRAEIKITYSISEVPPLHEG